MAVSSFSGAPVAVPDHLSVVPAKEGDDARAFHDTAARLRREVERERVCYGIWSPDKVYKTGDMVITNDLRVWVLTEDQEEAGLQPGRWPWAEVHAVLQPVQNVDLKMWKHFKVNAV
jgi:hypothetical protein